MKKIKKLQKKQIIVIASVVGLAALLTPLTAQALSSMGFIGQMNSWASNHCTKDNVNELFSSVCFLIGRDSEQQEAIDQLGNRIDELETVGVASNNLMLQIEGVNVGLAVDAGRSITFFSNDVDRLVEVTELGDTVSGTNLSYHFGRVEPLFYTSDDCTGDAYAMYASEADAEALKNYLLLASVNEHYVVARNEQGAVIDSGSVKRFDQVAKTATCYNDATPQDMNGLKVSAASMPIQEPLAKPFLFVYE